MPAAENVTKVTAEWVRKAESDLRAAARYPGWPEIPLKEAREAVALARRVRSEARRALPRAAVRTPQPKRRR